MVAFRTYPMRFTCLLVVTLFLISGTAHAQLGFGPEIGAGISNMRFAPPLYPINYTAASTSPIASSKIGGLIDLPLNRHFYFQAGIYVSREGAIRSFSYYKNDSFNEAVHQTLYVSYLAMPLNVIYKAGMQGKGRFFLGLGAVPSYIIGGRNKLQDHQVFNDTLTVTNDNVKVSVGHTLGGFDIGLNITTGYELPTGLFFRTYYTIGINDIGIGTEIDKNRMWGIAAGYLFGKGRNVNKEADDLIDKTPDPPAP